MTAWDSFSDDHEDYSRNRNAADRLKQALSVMFVMAGKKPGDEKIAMFMQSLKPLLHEPELYTFLEHAADEAKDCSPAKIKNEVYAIIRNKRPPVHTPELTEDERTRSRQAALKTALWLHYEHHWALATFGSHMMGAALKKQESLTDAQLIALLEQAKHKYPREEIARWMESQG